MKREDGISLIEILAGIVLTAVIAILLYSIVTRSTNSYDKQINVNKEVNDTAYALKVITKELRKAVNVTIEQSCTLQTETSTGTSLFELKEGILYQNSMPLADNLLSFKVTTGSFDENDSCNDGGSNQISVKLENNTNHSYATEIVLRRGDAN